MTFLKKKERTALMLTGVFIAAALKPISGTENTLSATI
jgi:hypothetical protein